MTASEKLARLEARHERVTPIFRKTGPLIAGADAFTRDRDAEKLLDSLRQLREAVHLLERLREWDALNPPPDPVPAPFADIIYWIAELDRTLARLSGALGDVR